MDEVRLGSGRNGKSTGQFALVDGLRGIAGARPAESQGLVHVAWIAKSSRRDGTVISLNAVRLPASLKERLPRGIKVFSLTYWSRGQRCQAYLDVPMSKRKHALYIQLHGGDIFGQASHWRGSSGDDLNTAVGYALSGVVSFFPNYLGYGPSVGVPGDPAQDFRDVRLGHCRTSHIP